MLLTNYHVRVFVSPCNPSAQTVNAVVEFEDDIGDLLPYINAELGPGIFDPKRPFLRFNREGRAIVFEPHKIGISKVHDEVEAEAKFREIRDIVRSIAERRSEIKPSYRTLGEVNALQVYKLLPKTNCRKCGFASCFAFAAAVAQSETDIEQCPLLREEDYTKQRAHLERMLGVSR